MKIYILLLFIVGFVQASPKRPFRDETPEDELNKDTSEEKDAEQEIAFGVFSYYDEDEEESELPAENRKRPNFPVFSEGSSFGSGGSNKPTGPPAFVIQNKDNDSEDTETLPYDVIERGYQYEVRSYPASKWICTEKTENIDDDVYKNWRLKYRNGFEAMRELKKERKQKEGKDGSMFMRLYKYIIGVNADAEEIEMTSPVTMKRSRLVLNREKQEMCFWSGSEWQNRQLPEPIKNNVVIKEKEGMEVFVKEFSGWALSHDDWEDKLQELANDIRDREDADTSGTFYTVGYSSPWVDESERRNEVWIEKIRTTKPKFTVSNSGSSSNEGSADDLTELLQPTLVDRGIGYEIHRYPKSKWACTKAYDVDPIKDPMNNWQTMYDNNPFMAMSKSAWERKPMNKMFMRLYKYIIGLNEDNIEIDMTRPVTTKMTQQRRSRTYDEEMCFWLGSKYNQDRDPPRPIDRQVTIEERQEMTFFVRQFGGFALSHDDVETQYDELKRDLRGEDFDSDVFYSVGYNSPFTVEDRRNEIWIEDLKNDRRVGY